MQLSLAANIGEIVAVVKEKRAEDQQRRMERLSTRRLLTNAVGQIGDQARQVSERSTS